MSFKDVFKNSFLNGYVNTSPDVKTIVVGLLITMVLGIYIFLVYRMITRKTFYNKTFNLSLPTMAMITAAIILTIQTNIVLSLGMVGALSIVRFRTAIKDPLDLVFLYWSISIGIICGAGISLVGIILSLLLTVVLFALQKYPDKKTTQILIVNSTCVNDEVEILNKIKELCKTYKIRSKNISKTTLEMIVEVIVLEESTIVSEISQIGEVYSAALLSHDGEITA